VCNEKTGRNQSHKEAEAAAEEHMVKILKI